MPHKLYFQRINARPTNVKIFVRFLRTSSLMSFFSALKELNEIPPSI